jgi:hypothetical protein
MRLRRLAIGLAVAAFATGAARAVAQSEKRIYVQYEGFIRQDDGSLILSFGYFNTGDAGVPIAVGDRNQFLPSPADRGQPTTFLKGRHRSACVMVAPKGFDGNIRWRVQYGATVSTTTAAVLDPNYALEQNSEKRATNGVDLRSVARLHCNEPKPLPARR